MCREVRAIEAGRHDVPKAGVGRRSTPSPLMPSGRSLVVALLFALDFLRMQRTYLYSRGEFEDHSPNNAVGGPTFPSHLDLQPACKVNDVLSDLLVSDVRIGWENQTRGAPDWLRAMCPEVVAHYDVFPIFGEHKKFLGVPLPISTTDYAARVVCTAKVVGLMASSVGARAYLHAGSHLGAIVHGSPIPWDDDVDMFLDFEKRHEFVGLCNKFGNKIPILTHPKRVELHCFMGWNSLKVWLQPEDSKRRSECRNGKWCSPYVDLFYFKIDSTSIREIMPNGKEKVPARVRFKLEDFFPTRPYYFGGAYLMGPREKIVELRKYRKHRCVMSTFNHRLEAAMPEGPLTVRDLCLDCRKLHGIFPFVYDKEDGEVVKVSGSRREQRLFPSSGTTFKPKVNTTIKQRLDWSKAAPSKGQQLTDGIRNLNEVEVDNTIAPPAEFGGKMLHVVEFNAERGRRWLESTKLLKQADVVILNEMDIGMARSDQQHTARVMAHHLGMNYAWGVEFVELTLGDAGDRKGIDKRERNFHGLHGNAILSKFEIRNATIFRGGVGSYFDDKPNAVNAGGLERRLGGRMIMLARVIVNGAPIVVGSTHKLGGVWREEIKGYIGADPAVVAGDQGPKLCTEIGLGEIKSKENHPTWPASCDSLGSHRGDIICSNMKVAVDEYTIKPCFRQYGLNISLGDHALTGAMFELPG